MGNRAIITTPDKEIGVYLHWNGGRDSVEGFLKYCKDKKYRCPSYDCYGWACLCGVIFNYFGQEGLSLGIDRYDRLDRDNHDNGVYIIKNWEIISREHFHGPEQNSYKLDDMVQSIAKANKLKLENI